HHENEIAQSEAANNCHYANYWMHAGAVRLDGEKMSKSLGNFFTIRDVLQKYHPEVVRYLLIASHYRSAINYSEDNLIEAKSGLTRLYTALRDFADIAPATGDELAADAEYQRFVAAMNDDFNTRVALAVMFDLARALNTAATEDSGRADFLAAVLKAMANVLGLLQERPEGFLQAASANAMTAETVDALVAERIAAKKAKNFSRADEIRGQLQEAGIVLEDSADGTRWRRDS
ncbi:MAG TPA: DALR domain-containing protein, partial [Cellvibrionaceae bacterium]